MHLYIGKEVSENSNLCGRDAGLVMGYHFAGGCDRSALRPTPMIGWKTGELGSPTGISPPSDLNMPALSHLERNCSAAPLAHRYT